MVTKSGEICIEYLIELENMFEGARAPFVSVPSYRDCKCDLPRAESSCIKSAQGLVNEIHVDFKLYVYICVLLFNIFT